MADADLVFFTYFPGLRRAHENRNRTWTTSGESLRAQPQQQQHPGLQQQQQQQRHQQQEQPQRVSEVGLQPEHWNGWTAERFHVL